MQVTFTNEEELLRFQTILEGGKTLVVHIHGVNHDIFSDASMLLDQAGNAMRLPKHTRHNIQVLADSMLMHLDAPAYSFLPVSRQFYIDLETGEAHESRSLSPVE